MSLTKISWIYHGPDTWCKSLCMHVWSHIKQIKRAFSQVVQMSNKFNLWQNKWFWTRCAFIWLLDLLLLLLLIFRLILFIMNTCREGMAPRHARVPPNKCRNPSMTHRLMTLLCALEVSAAPRSGTFDLQPCKPLRELPAGPNPPAATSLSHDQCAALARRSRLSISVFIEEESSWMTIHVRRICFTRRQTASPCGAPVGRRRTHANASPGPTQDHADAGEVGGGEFYGRYDGRGLQRWSLWGLRSTAQIPVQQTGVPGSVPGRGGVLGGSHVETHRHREGDQAAAVVHWLCRVSNTPASIFSCTQRPLGGGFPGPPHELVNNSISCDCCDGRMRVTDILICAERMHYTEAYDKQSPWWRLLKLALCHDSVL